VYYWQGKDANALLAQWGAPSKNMTMPNGNTLYTYSKSYTQQQPYFDNRRFEPGSRFTVTENGQSRVIETRDAGCMTAAPVVASCTTAAPPILW
jgi:hypothetical protein